MNGLVVGIGDLHGHYPTLKRILDSLHSSYRIFQPSDPDRLRRGIKLVLTGDYIDRGDNALGIIDRLRRLDKRNPGQIIPLLGNHELMALECYDDAVALLGRDRRRGARGAMREYEQTSHGWNGGTEFIREFGKATLPALKSYVDRMAPSGDIGSWMRALQPCYQTQIAGRKVLFMHADLHETFRDRVHLERYLEEMNEWRKVSSAAAGGTREKWGRLAEFVWDRSYTKPSPIRKSAVEKLCRDIGVDYIVTGHTPHPSVEGIKVHGGRIFDIDVGMTPALGGNMAQALVLSRNGIVGFRADGKKRLFVRFKSMPPR